jgi:hypothetical protein
VSERQGRGARLTPAIRFLALLGLLGLGACAKTGDPQPPQPLIPRPAADLEARQSGSQILLTVSPPALNTNGTRATTLDRVEVFRVAGPREGIAPLPGASFLSRAERIRTIPAADVAGYLRNGKLTIPDDAPKDPAAFYTYGYGYAVLFVNRRNQAAGLSNQVFIAPVAIPPAPGRVQASVTPDAIRLTWDAPSRNEDGSTPARIAGYNVYRSEDPKIVPPQPLNAEPLPDPGFVDRAFEFDKTYFYAVSVVGSRENPYAESAASTLLRVQAADVFAPGAPGNLDAVIESGIVTLLWGPPEDADIAGYRVYRRQQDSPARALLQEELVTVMSFRDERVRPGGAYEYSVAAVDTHGNEGPAATIRVEVK